MSGLSVNKKKPPSSSSSSAERKAICRYYQRGMCRKGKSCSFHHPSKPCVWFKAGTCNYGDLCKFSHAASPSISGFAPVAGSESSAASRYIPTPPMMSLNPRAPPVMTTTTVTPTSSRLAVSETIIRPLKSQQAAGPFPAAILLPAPMDTGLRDPRRESVVRRVLDPPVAKVPRGETCMVSVP